MGIIRDFSIIFMSIFLESLPFLLLGSLLSAIIEVYISDDIITKIMPKNKLLASIFGVIMGFFIPACDCAVIPITRRLIKKKIPINVSISFMLSSPIINPVVLLSTYTAFYKTNPSIFWYRLILGIIISIVVGIVMEVLFSKKEIIMNSEDNNCHCHNHEKSRLLKIVDHTFEDLYSVTTYMIIGTLIATSAQVFLPRTILTMFNQNILSIIALMIFAYLLSLCSTADSFVGKSLLGIFSEKAVIAYLLLGPMIDIKNTIVLLNNYHKKFVVTLISIIFIIIFVTTLMVVKIS